MASASAALPHIPVLRAGVEYTSLETVEVVDHRTGAPLARVSQANAGLVRRDVRRCAAAAALRALPCARLLEVCKRAADLFMTATLPLNRDGDAQSPDEYVAALSATSGLPHTLCRANMQKVRTVLEGMEAILRGLTRGLDLGVLDAGIGEQGGVPVCYAPVADALGVVLPSNSPGVNSIWLPALALKMPVVLKPGREEPWTPLRIAAACIAAGCPPEAFHFYPTDHQGAAAILEGCGRALLFGDETTTQAWAANSGVQIHGPGRSKVLLGPDVAESWAEHLDALAASVADHGGRSCINASTIVVAARRGAANGKGGVAPADSLADAVADAVADALAQRLAQLEPRAAADPEARLAAFANPAVADAVDARIEAGLAAGGAEDITARYRGSGRARQVDGARFLLPTVVRCASIEHPLARTEFLFPFVSVVAVPAEAAVEALGPSLVVAAITKDPELLAALVRSPHVGRLNIGPVPTSRVEWDQPHEGNLFELLYERRALQRAPGW